MDVQTDGDISEITPRRLSKKDQNHCWVFALHREVPSQRNDGREYTVFIFRNDERTIFGLNEFYDWQRVDFRKMATRVIQDKEYRQSLISEDPDLPKIWKKH
ncbi:MAG: hypothetical protein ABL984_17550 [Pyrinomonadaceae bacterium]